MSRKKKLVLIILAIVCSPILFLITWSILGFCYLAPFEGKVIDVDTKERIEGAAVLAVYHGTTSSVAGSSTYAVDAQETLTDPNGEFRISSKFAWFGEVAGWPRGKIIIFRPGYGVFPNHKQSDALGVNKTWPPPNKYIVYELPKLKTRKERDNNLNLSRPSGIPYEKMRNFIISINEERRSLGYDPLTVPKEGK